MAWQGGAGSERAGRGMERRGCGWARGRWTPVEIGAMVLGFIFFWPIGLAILFLKLWRGHVPVVSEIDITDWMRLPTRRRSGNHAFEEYRAAELRRLEEERRRLIEEERAFEEYLTRLKRAKDQEEFDRFMAERHRPAAG